MTETPPTPAAFSGSYAVPELGLERRWCMAADLPPARIPELVELLARAYNGGPLWFALPVDHGDHFRWKYLDFPGGAQMLLTVDPDERVIRFMGSALRRWLIQGHVHIASDGMDLALEPAWQGRRMNRAFRPFRGRSWHPDVEFDLSYYTHPADVHLANTGDGWQLGNPVQTLVRPLGVGSLVPHRLRALRRRRNAEAARVAGVPPDSRTAEAIRAAGRTNRDRLANVAGAYTRYARSLARRRPRPGGSRFQPVTVERFDQPFEELVAVASGDFDLIQERSLEYLNWRFRDPRGGPFFVRAVMYEGAAFGYAVTHVRDGRAWLGDLLVQPGRDDVARTLVEDALDIARRHRATVMLARLARRHPYRGALRDAGFVVETADAGVWVEPRQGDTPQAMEILKRPDARIHITFGDSDQM